MRITYICKSGVKGNDEEGAIEHALTAIGCRVSRVDERAASSAVQLSADLILCHHLPDPNVLYKCTAPAVFWCFDRIDDPDESMQVRWELRKKWAIHMTKHSSIGFFTDGDWVDKDTTNKLYWLPQAADQRVVNPTLPPLPAQDVSHGSAISAGCDLLFTGVSKNGGILRERWVENMVSQYGPRFNHYVGRKHGAALVELIRRANVVLAPDAPCSDKYWSNRVYLTLGYGGFLLHPYCVGLFKHYDQLQDIVFYRSPAELRDLISHYLARPDLRYRIASAGMARTMRDHTYLNRCAELLRIVKERLGIGCGLVARPRPSRVKRRNNA